MERKATLGLLPLPEHRRKFVRPMLYLGVLLVFIGRIADSGFVWGLGVGLVVFSLLVRLLDWYARRRAQA